MQDNWKISKSWVSLKKKRKFRWKISWNYVKSFFFLTETMTRFFCVWWDYDWRLLLKSVKKWNFVKNFVKSRVKFRENLTWFISQVSWDKSWTPIMQWSAWCPCKNFVTSPKKFKKNSVKLPKIAKNSSNHLPMTFLKTKSSSLESNHPKFVILAKSVTSPCMTNWANFGWLYK